MLDLILSISTCARSASDQRGEVESSTRKKVKRLLSFQRYCHSSRLLRGDVPQTPGSLHLLDEDYLGQAVVWTCPVKFDQYSPHPDYSKLLFPFWLLLQHMLSKVGTWNFDIFLFDRLTNGMLTDGTMGLNGFFVKKKKKKKGSYSCYNKYFSVLQETAW